MIRLLALTLLILAGQIWFSVSDPLTPHPAPPGVRLLDQAEFVISDAHRPPAEGWTQVSLPDNWRERDPTLRGVAWYRIRFDLAEVPRAPQALYLPRVAVIGELWLNEAQLSTDVRFDQPGQLGEQTVDAPFYAMLPSSALRQGQNELLVKVQGDQALRSGLSAVRFAPATVLEPIWWRQYLPQVLLPYGLIILLAAALCLAYAYAHRRRQFRAIQIALLLGGFSLALDMVPELPMSRGDRQVVRMLVFSTVFWLLCLANTHLSREQPAWLSRLILGVWLLTMTSVGLAAITGLGNDRVWLLLWPFIALWAFLLALLMLNAWRDRSVRLMLLALTAALWVATVAQSLVLIHGVLPWDSFRYSSAGAIPLCAMVLLFFAERFVLDREEAMRDQRAAVGAERSRILQDMHDGMGAQLITAKRMAMRPDVDRADVAQAIDESLQDLRLIIDSLDLVEPDLLPLLGNLRFRLEPRLASLGIKLSWEVQPLPALPGLNPAAALAILRIVQEAINNALRHADPRTIRIIVEPDGADIRLCICDDGMGFEPSAASPGARGLSGMRQRAAKLGASLHIDSGPQGTTVRLRIPGVIRDQGAL